MNPIHPAFARLARAAAHQDFGEVEETLYVALRKPTWLRPEHRVGDPNGYMRHILYVDPQDRFVITAITWLPGQVSAVHGHQVWCVYGVAEGELTEEQFRMANDKLGFLKKKTYRPGDLADRDLDQTVIHRVSNKSQQPLVSLHLYGVAASRITTGINRIY
jgi:predicted metal-dependent enzyme (double-stranded beta helix superfamily)